MNTVVKTSHFFKKIFTVIFWSWPIVLALIWFQPQQDFLAALGLNISNFIPVGLFNHVLTPLSASTKALGFVTSFIPMVIGMLISWLFIRLFHAYEQNDIFSVKSIRILKGIAFVMILGVILDPFYQALMSFVLTMHNPPGSRLITLGIDAGSVRNLITAGLIYLIAYIMQEEVKLHEEQALTI